VLKLSVAVSGDAIGAKLRIEGFTPEEWRARWSGPSVDQGVDRLQALLATQGIDADAVRVDALKWICETLAGSSDSTRNQDLEAVQGVDVAQGRGPVHEEAQGLAFHHSYLSNAEAIVELRRKADAWGFGGIRESIDPAYWVSSGATVLSFQSAIRGIPGSDVFGAPIPFLPVRDRLPPFGKSLFLKQKKLIAVCDGALIVEDGQLKVLGSDSLPTCQVVVAEDRMSANLVLGGNYLNDWTVTMDMVHAALREQGVLCMVAETEIQSALDRFNRDHLPLTLLVARGRPPLSGENGRVRMIVDPEPDVPLPGADGSIDFKDFSFFRTVAKGTRLAEVLPPVPGQPGMNVHGEEIPSPEAKPFASEPGPNTELEGIDPLYLAASVSGRLAIKRGIPEVVEVLDVTGDVSLKTGNVEFPGAVKVAGDVHNKMSIQAVGDVEVVGTVEDSVIRSDGAIVIRGGVNGLGKGIIKSRLSSVTIGYLHNQRIESNSHIVVYNEIINSNLKARKTISMRFGKYSVLGGHLLAGESMDLFNVGSEAGSKAILEVGKDFEVESDLAEKNELLISHSQDLDFLRDMDDELARVLRLRRNPSDEETLLHKRTQGAMENLDRWITDLRRKLAELSQRLYNPDICEILIRGVIHPGTVIKYREHILIVPTLLTHRKWLFREKGPVPPAEGHAI
jgi:uncharacterized protein (DUF342 family)